MSTVIKKTKNANNLKDIYHIETKLDIKNFKKTNQIDKKLDLNKYNFTSHFPSKNI